MNSSHDSDDLRRMRPTERFADCADDYRRYRPAYPGAAIDAVLDGLGSPASLLAADVGAGTGISARLLADRGVRVVAVEPNAAMQGVAEPHPLVTWRDGRAEATGLESASVGLVLCAQAFHWFEPEVALAEFHRILLPGGRLALLWNERDEGDPATAAFSNAVRDASKDDSAERRPFSADALRSSRRFRGADVVEAPNVQRLDAEGLLGRATSASYVARDGPARDRLVEALHRVFMAHAGPGGLVSLVYRTRVHRATRAGR